MMDMLVTNERGYIRVECARCAGIVAGYRHMGDYDCPGIMCGVEIEINHGDPSEE